MKVFTPQRMAMALVLPLGSFIASCDSVGPGKTKEKVEYVEVEGTGGGDSGAGGETIEQTVIDPNAMRLAFLSPTEPEVEGDAAVQISVEITNVSPSATWSLYYTPNNGDVADGVTIVKDQKVTDTAIAWDTSLIGAGTYFLFAAVTDNSVTAIFWGNGSVLIGDEAGDFRTPVVNIQSPLGNDDREGNGQVVRNGDTLNIQFSASDPDGDALTYKIEYSVDDGLNWALVAENLNNDNLSYDWTIPADIATTARLRLRVTASDGTVEGRATMENPIGAYGTTDPLGNATTGDRFDYCNDILPILQTACIGCHATANDPPLANEGNGQAPGQLDLRIWDQNNNPRGINDRRDRVVERMFRAVDANGFMPQGATEVNTDHQDMIQLWRWSGAFRDKTLAGNNQNPADQLQPCP